MSSQHAVVERFQLTVLPGTDISSAAASLIQELTVPTPPGLISGYWGTVEEEENKLEFWLTWDTLASHMAFSTPAKIHAVTQILIPIAAAMPVVYHVAFTTEFRVPVQSKAVAEILSFTPAPKEVEFPVEGGLEGSLGNAQGKAIEKIEGLDVYVVVVWWDDENGRGVEKRIEGLRADGGDAEMELQRCHLRLRHF